MTEQEIVIRDITAPAEMHAVEELQKEVWGMSDRDIVSVFMLAATNAAGGLLVGAYAAGALVGFAYGFVGLGPEGRAYMHSDMLAVREEYRGRGLGLRLKLAQRERALARGLSWMTWTFDPLRAGNAHLNFAKLGVVSDRYLVNFYGEHSTSSMHSTGTDRLWVRWPLASRRVGERAEGRPPAAGREALAGLPALVSLRHDGSPAAVEFDEATHTRALIEIPGDIGRVERDDPSLAYGWRRATRRAFTAALGAGLVVEEFYRGEGRAGGTYLLTAGRRPEDFA